MPSIAPPYPYDPSTRAITLPAALAHEIFHLAEDAGLAEATQRVVELTGAPKKIAQAYVEALLQAR